MSIQTLPTELHIQILSYLLPSISDQISLSLTCKHWQKILNNHDFKPSRYNFLPPNNTIGIHKLFDFNDIGNSIPPFEYGKEVDHSWERRRPGSRYNHDIDPENIRLNCEYNCDTRKVTSYYYLLDNMNRDQEDNNTQSSNLQDRFTKVDISKCPFFDEPLIITTNNPGIPITTPAISIKNTKTCLDRKAIFPMERRKATKYRTFISHLDPTIHPIRPMTSIGKHAGGHYLSRILRIAKCECDLDVRYICSLLYGGPYSICLETAVERCRYDIEVFWPGEKPSSVDVTVRETAQAVVDAVLNGELDKDVVDVGLNYVRTFGFAAAITAPWEMIGRRGNDGCRWWNLEGFHYGPWRKVHRRQSTGFDEFNNNPQQLQSHEGEIVDRMGTISIS
ncbi:hypothetical protein TWF506_003716 [Arthrobotrys conoides]|uniref:F-box domain-containing protein n=1 Tax=Arthrobotrys conoides TaxID=74498 RepID=A0AAN8RQN9_9PEZI